MNSRPRGPYVRRIVQRAARQPARPLAQIFRRRYDEVVLVRDISFNSMCEHHMLPFMGAAHIAYVPSGRDRIEQTGPSGRRRGPPPEVQERMTEPIANLLDEEFNAKGVAVVVEAIHTCMTIRGIRKPGCLCVTSAMKGCFRTKPSTRPAGTDDADLRGSPLTIVTGLSSVTQPPSAVFALPHSRGRLCCLRTSWHEYTRPVSLVALHTSCKSIQHSIF